MLEAPAVANDTVVARLRADYHLPIAAVDFLPLGADPNTAVYRAVADGGEGYFVKLRRGRFDPVAVELPKLLANRGMHHVIAPIATKSGQLWTELAPFTLVVYPFIEARTALEVPMSDRQWRAFGAALKTLHTTDIPAALIRRVPRITYAPNWRERVKTCVTRADSGAFDTPYAIRAAAFVRAQRAAILDLVERADRLALAMPTRAPEPVVCHSDVHAGNILIDARAALYIVDWDAPVLAPKERDLMFIGGAQGFLGRSARDEESAFYRGYGDVHVDPIALAYFRCERIIEDIAIYCDELFSNDRGGADRQRALRYLMANFQPGGTIDAANRDVEVGTR